MNTISNERLEELANGDMEVWYSESQSMARELLALRKERERAEPVAWMLTDNEFGHSVATKAGFTLNFYRSKGWGVTPLYTAPPAPVVPDISAAKYYTEDGAFKAFDYKRDLNATILKGADDAAS